MNRWNGRSLLTLGVLVIALLVTACGGGSGGSGGSTGGGMPGGGNGDGNGDGNGGPPAVEHQDTGSITATMDGGNETWHTVEGTFQDGGYFNTAQWYVHEETGHYRVRLQGRPTKNFYDMDKTIELIFALEPAQGDSFALATPIVDGPPEVGYFPDGPTLGDAYYFADGELSVSEATKTGTDTLSVRGTFSGTLEKGAATIEVVGGEFDIRKATRQPLHTLGWVDDDYGKVPNPLSACIQTDPCEIGTLEQLQAIAEYKENLRHNYKLIADIDATETATWVHDDGTGGFVPIGTMDDRFTGEFDGNGKTISNLHIDRSAHPDLFGAVSGLFGAIGDRGKVAALTLEDVDVSGAHRVGGLVGLNAGDVRDVLVSGEVAGVGSPSAGVGGVAGENTGTIADSDSDVTVEADDVGGGLVGTNNGKIENGSSQGQVTAQIAGGLVGQNGPGRRSTISDSSSSATVTGLDGGHLGTVVGGLVGRNYGSANYKNVISESDSSGPVRGFFETGGLVGRNDEFAIIRDSHSTSDVDGDGTHHASHGTGGLVGANYGIVERGHSEGEVTGTVGAVGGLVGFNNQSGSITHSFSTGSVKGGQASDHVTGGLVGGNQGIIRASFSNQLKVEGSWAVGGLVGRAFVNSNIEDSYSMSDVQGQDYYHVGGLIGYFLQGELRTSYSVGEVMNTGDNVGGLVGFADPATMAQIVESYWDTGTSGQADSKGGDGLTTTAMKNQGSYGNEWDFTAVWEMSSVDGYPDLIENPRD